MAKKMDLRSNLYDNWKEILIMGLPRDHQHMRALRHLLKGNLHYMIRRLIGGVPSDTQEWVDEQIAKGVMNPPDEFNRRRLYEARKRKNQQHS